MNISLIITIHDRGRLLRPTLERLKRLTPPDELIVVNDGGNDDTKQVVWDYAMQADHETEYIYTHNPGVTICSHARNVGVKLARNEFVVTSEPELWWRSDVLAQFAQLQSEHPREVISSGLVWFAPDGFTPGPDDFEPDPAWEVATRWVAPHCALYRRDDLMAVGGWDESFPGNWGWDDTDLLTRLRANGVGQFICPEIEAVHQFHGLGGDASFQNESHFLAKDIESGKDIVANGGVEWGIAKPRPQ